MPAPEQMGKLPGAEVRECSDVYGFGRTCCFALFGTPQPGLKHWKQLSDDGLRELLDACIAEQPKERPADFGAVLEKLARSMRPPSPPPIGVGKPVPAPPLTPIALPLTPDEEEKIVWGTAERNGTAESYQNYIKRHPKGQHAKEARYLAAQLLRDRLLSDMENVPLRWRYLGVRTKSQSEADWLLTLTFEKQRRSVCSVSFLKAFVLLGLATVVVPLCAWYVAATSNNVPFHDIGAFSAAWGTVAAAPVLVGHLPCSWP